MMDNFPNNNQNDRQDELSANAEDKNVANKTKRDAVKGEDKHQKMLHDLPQDEQMLDEFGKGGEPVPPGETKSDMEDKDED